MTRITNLCQHQTRTEEEMREALQRFCNAAWNKSEQNQRMCFTIPPDSEDADIILGDAIHEVIEARTLLHKAQAILERFEQGLWDDLLLTNAKDLRQRIRALIGNAPKEEA